MAHAPTKVTVNGPDVSGSYVLAEQRDDGTRVLRPESSDEVIDQFADHVLTEDEFVGSLERLHAAKLREER